MKNQKQQEFQISISRSNWNRINIAVTDRHSRVRLFTGSMSLEDWALASTGLSGQTIVVDQYVTPEQAAVIGKKKRVERVSCPKVSGVGKGKEDQRAMVLTDFHTYHASRGWKIHDDGTGSQQPDRERHYYSIYKHEGPDYE